jgi:hypothetical protein
MASSESSAGAPAPAAASGAAEPVKLRLALCKGRMQEGVVDLLKSAGVDVRHLAGLAR